MPWAWSENGVENGGSIHVFNGLLVVRQSESVHAELRRLLEALRSRGRV